MSETTKKNSSSIFDVLSGKAPIQTKSIVSFSVSPEIVFVSVFAMIVILYISLKSK